MEALKSFLKTNVHLWYRAPGKCIKMKVILVHLRVSKMLEIIYLEKYIFAGILDSMNVHIFGTQ